MRILIYGAGNMGCLYAAKLARAGQDVAILARGDRYDVLRKHGITLQDGESDERTTTAVPVVDSLNTEDAYDLVLVVLPKPAIAEVLPILAANEHTPSVMFFGNNAAGPGPMASVLGADRVLLWLPESLTVFLMKKMFASKTMAIKVGHAQQAMDEWRLLAEEFRALNAEAGVAMPAMERLLAEIKK